MQRCHVGLWRYIYPISGDGKYLEDLVQNGHVNLLPKPVKIACRRIKSMRMAASGWSLQSYRLELETVVLVLGGHPRCRCHEYNVLPSAAVGRSSGLFVQSGGATLYSPPLRIGAAAWNLGNNNLECQQV